MTNATDPREFERRVLVCSLGLSPQVVTEAVFALARDGTEWRPTELVLLTTPEGAEVAAPVLLDRDDGALGRLAEDRGWVWLSELPVRTVVAAGEGGLETHAALADVALRLLRELCSDAAAAVHVVVTGGRKTAAAATALAMALVGRPQDRMSHVLVDDTLAANPAFFFPPRSRKMILGSDGRLHDASAAEVRLIEVPFPRLRAYADTALEDFAAMIAGAQSRLERWRLRIDLAGGTISWDGRDLRLPPAIAAFAAWLADDLLYKGEGGIRRTGASPEGYIEAYRRLRGSTAAFQMQKRLHPAAEPEWMQEKASRLNKLAAACGVRPRGATLVVRAGGRPCARYRLSLDAEEVDWIGPAL